MPGLSLSIPTVAHALTKVVYEPEAAALCARMTVAPPTARKRQIDGLVGALKAAGVWNLLDCLYLLAAANSQAARLNWISADYTLAAVNGPTFTVDRGYQGDGAASFLNTGFNPATAGGHYGQDSAMLAIFSLTDLNAVVIDIGCRSVTQQSCLLLRAAGNFDMRVNTATNYVSAVANSVGFFAASRTDATTITAYVDGETLQTFVAPSAVPYSAPMYIGAANASISGVPSYFSPRKYAAAVIGGGLSAAEMAALSAAIGTYLTQVGAV